MTEEVIVLNSEDDEIPKSPLYLSESPEGTKLDRIQVIDEDQSEEVIEVGNNDNDLVPDDVARSIAKELKPREVPKIDLTDKQPKILTSSIVKEWATEQQKRDLEEGEIIDDDLQVISVTDQNKVSYRTLAEQAPKPRTVKRRLKYKNKNRNLTGRPNNASNLVHKRKVTINKHFKTFHQLPWSKNNSGNQDHSWPIASMVSNENDIDRRKHVPPQYYTEADNDYSKLLKEYENVKAAIHEAETVVRKPDDVKLIRVLESDDEDDIDDDVSLAVLREKALESANQKRLKSRSRGSSFSSVARKQNTYERMLRRDKKWIQIQPAGPVCTTSISKRKRSVSIQVTPHDFDLVSPMDMDISSDNDTNTSKTIYINPSSGISTEEGSYQNTENEDENEEERLRSILLKQVEQRRAQAASEFEAHTTVLGPVMCAPISVDNVVPPPRGSLVATHCENLLNVYGDHVPTYSNTPPLILRSEYNEETELAPRSLSAPMICEDVQTASPILNAAPILETAQNTPGSDTDAEPESEPPKEVLGPEVPDLTASPLPADLPSHYDGRLLPLQPPVICDVESSTSESSSSDDEASVPPEKLHEKLQSLKNKLRKQQLKTERKKLYLRDLKKLRRNKLTERSIVKVSLTTLIEKQANYEQYLKEVFHFITDIKRRLADSRLEIYKSDKAMVELKMKINEIREGLGLRDEEIDEKKMIEIERLNKKRVELEEKLSQMAAIIKKATENEDKQETDKIQSPDGKGCNASESLSVHHTFTNCNSFEEITTHGLPTMQVKLTALQEPLKKPSTVLVRETIPLDNDFIFSEYKSPLLVFRSYRFSPYFRRHNLDIASPTFSHKLDCLTNFCGYNLTGKCNDARCTGQHWRDVVLTPDELFLDLLSYNGDLIKLNSFEEYQDKLKASAAFVNRILPPELSLNLAQKCLFLVEEINSLSKTKEPHIASTYASVDKFNLQHNKRKIGSVLSRMTKRKRLISGFEYYEPSLDDDELTHRYFMTEHYGQKKLHGDTDGSLLPSYQVIRELEEYTLNNPRKVDAWLSLERKLTSSTLHKKYELGLACLSEALNYSPTNADLWRRYLILFNKSQKTDSLDEFNRVMQFCDDNVELSNSFWTKRINMPKNIQTKGLIVEKYISRLISLEEGTAKYETQLLNAIMFRSYLFTLEGNLNEAGDTIVDFMQVFTFRNGSKLIMWLTYLALQILRHFPHEMTSSSIDLGANWKDLKLDFIEFDPSLYPMIKPGPSENDIAKLNIEKDKLGDVAAGLEEIIESWDDVMDLDSLSLLLQLTEILHQTQIFSENCGLAVARKIPKVETWLLADYLSSLSSDLSELSTIEEAITLLGPTPRLTYLIAYCSVEVDDENGFSPALNNLEAAIAPYYKGIMNDIGTEEPTILLQFKRLLQLSVSIKEPMLQTPKTYKYPDFEHFSMKTFDESLGWIWCCYILLEYICNQDNDLTELFELALRCIKMECTTLWVYYIIWSSKNKSTCDVASLIHRFTTRFSGSPLTTIFVEYFFAKFKADNGAELLHNICSISTNVKTLLLCAKIFYDNEQYAKTKSVLRPLTKNKKCSIDVWKLYAAAERKINDRNIPELIRLMIERFYTSREIIRLGVLYWKRHADSSLKKQELNWIRTFVTGVGHVSLNHLLDR